VIDYSEPGWEERVPAGTVLLDGTGGAIGRALFERTVAGGRVVLFGWSSGRPFHLRRWATSSGWVVIGLVRDRRPDRCLAGRDARLETAALARRWVPADAHVPARRRGRRARGDGVAADGREDRC
jgi:NADPH2:quinone reductase